MQSFIQLRRTFTMLEKNIPLTTEIGKNGKQYHLGQILSIWALGALPMAILTWVVAPTVIPSLPFHPGITYWCLMIVGMTWQMVVSLAIIYGELGTLRWQAIRQRTWLNTPRQPSTNQPGSRLFWWLLPCLFFSALINLGLGNYINMPVTWLFPALKAPIYTNIDQLVNPRFIGQWWILGIFLISALLNYFLGEEFLFRGILLPKMKGVFGHWDWVANALLFGLYHLHKPWEIPGIFLSSLAITWPARRFQSNWMAIIVHGVEGIIILILVLSVILGLAS
jgi:uncharacterized protein